jgi:hypothetical protein
MTLEEVGFEDMDQNMSFTDLVVVIVVVTVMMMMMMMIVMHLWIF